MWPAKTYAIKAPSVLVKISAQLKEYFPVIPRDRLVQQAESIFTEQTKTHKEVLVVKRKDSHECF